MIESYLGGLLGLLLDVTAASMFYTIFISAFGAGTSLLASSSIAQGRTDNNTMNMVG